MNPILTLIRLTRILKNKILNKFKGKSMLDIICHYIHTVKIHWKLASFDTD